MKSGSCAYFQCDWHYKDSIGISDINDVVDILPKVTKITDQLECVIKYIQRIDENFNTSWYDNDAFHAFNI